MAAVMAAVVAGPRWWLLGTSAPGGARVPISPWGASNIGLDESLYGASLREAYDGVPSLLTRYTGLSNRAPALPGAFWVQVDGLLGRFTGGPFHAQAITFTIATVATMLLLYVLALEISGSRLIAMAAVPSALVFGEVFQQVGSSIPLAHFSLWRPVLQIDPGRSFHPWYRFIAPSMVLAPFFGSVIAIPRAIETGMRRWMLCASAALALVIYSYLFYWIALALALGWWGLTLLMRRDAAAAGRLAALTIIAGVLALPELIARLAAGASLSADARARIGVHHLQVNASLASSSGRLALFCLPIVYLLVRERDERRRFYVALLLSPLILAPFEGVLPQPDHFLSLVWPPFAVPALLAAGSVVLQTLRRHYATAGGAAVMLLAVLAVSHTTVIQARALQAVNPSFAVSSDEDAALSWLRTQAVRGAVVVSPSVITNILVASLTPAPRYVKDGFVTSPSDAELVDRFLRAEAAYGFNADDALGRLVPVNRPLAAGTAATLQRSVEKGAAFYLLNDEVSVPGSVAQRIDGWRSQYLALVAERDVLRAYRADYLYCGPRERLWTASAAARGTMVRLVFRRATVAIYQRTSPSDPAAMEFKGCDG
ncbi:MAG TPA: hypothetical protein VEZ14_01030 [Dehalococcoidia bacterium]|nr:hypothetical protein [Dehalococcoidia bacterium]